MSKVVLIKDSSMTINQFTADIITSRNDLKDILREIFYGFYNGKCSNFLKNTTDYLLDEWLIKNMSPTITEVKIVIVNTYNKESNANALRIKLSSVLQDFNKKDDIITEIVVNKRKNIDVNSFIDKIINDLFNEKIDIFLDQTAIQFIGRFLMVFVGIDKNAWAGIQPQSAISNKFLLFYWLVRQEMIKIVPSIYKLNELDWIYIPEITREGLIASELQNLNFYESQLDKYLGRMYQVLNRYDYNNVNSDLWKTVYQKILPPEEILRLGFVRTPDEIVDSILDLVGYNEEREDLCKLTVLDPACGSGTFLVNALNRLNNHLDNNQTCHKYSNQPEWKIQETKLKIILNNLVGIDINPFATFLTTLNLTFILIDTYSKISQKNPNIQLSFKILTNDTLAPEINTTYMQGFINSRRTEAVENMKKFSALLKEKFDLIIGNPPWGTVLKGKIGPLGDDEKRLIYKKDFVSASGKYDIYVLFMERGIKLLKDGGILGFITQINYVSQDYGEGIKKIIKRYGAILYFVNLRTLGKILFPQWTNYPAITIFKKGVKQKEIINIEVTRNV